MGSPVKLSLLVFTIIIIVFIGTRHVKGASILFYFGVSTYSHRILVWPYVEKLAALGHDVTFLSGFPPKNPNPNVTEFTPKSLQDLVNVIFGSEVDLIEHREQGQHYKTWTNCEESGVILCDTMMKDPEYVNFIKNKRFDLVVIDYLNNECGYGIAKYHNAKFIIFNTNHPIMWQYDSFGMPAETSFIPDTARSYPPSMSFSQRIANTLWPLRWYFNRVFFVYPKMEAAINAGFGWEGEDRISFRDMEQDTSLVLLNSHFTVDYARSLPPMYIPVCGLHITPSTTKLPKNIQEFADGSGDAGFFYVSFGSALSISKAKPEIRQAFFGAFGKSHMRFIWKWDGDRPADMPKNVFTAPWMPQAEILAHPKIKAFITHSGLLGTAEAIANAVPLIAFPCFADQDYNADRMEQVGYGIKLELIGLKQQDVEDAMDRIITDTSYKKNMQEISKRFMDRQNHPLDTAVWWTEYILRHEKSRLLLPNGRYQYWFVRRSLDVWGFIIGSLGLIIGVILGYLICSQMLKPRITRTKVKKNK